MVIYFLFLSLILFLGFLLNKKIISKKIFTIISMLIAGFFLGLRGYNTGIDTKLYLKVFDYIKQLTWRDCLSGGFYVKYNTLTWVNSTHTFNETIEVGYALLNKMCSFFMPNRIFILLISIVECSLFGVFIYKNVNDHIFLGIIIFLCEALYMNSFNLFRQMLAMSIGINSLQFLRNKKYFKGLLILCISCMIHTSAVVLLSLFFLSLVNCVNYKKFLFICFIIIFLIFISFSQLITIAIKLFPRYANYLTSNYWSADVGGTIIVWIIGLIISFLIILKNKINQVEFIAIACLMIYIFFEVLGFRLTMFSRASLYFRFSYIIILPNVDKIFKKDLKVIYYICLLTILFMEFASYSVQPSMQYYFFWN